MEEIDVSHLAGAFDMGGRLSVKIAERDSIAIGYNFRAICRITIPDGHNNPLTGKFMAYCEDNVVNYSTSVDGDSLRIIIENPEDIRRFLEPMLKYLVAQYELSLIMLEEIVPRMKDDQHREKEGFLELMEYVDMIRTSARQSQLKYDTEYFEKEWSLTQ